MSSEQKDSPATSGNNTAAMKAVEARGENTASKGTMDFGLLFDEMEPIGKWSDAKPSFNFSSSSDDEYAVEKSPKKTTEVSGDTIDSAQSHKQFLVTNISYAATDEELHFLFGSKDFNLKIANRGNNVLRRGSVIVHCYDAEAEEKCLSLNKFRLNNRELRIDLMDDSTRCTHGPRRNYTARASDRGRPPKLNSYGPRSGGPQRHTSSSTAPYNQYGERDTNYGYPRTGYHGVEYGEHSGSRFNSGENIPRQYSGQGSYANRRGSRGSRGDRRGDRHASERSDAQAPFVRESHERPKLILQPRTKPMDAKDDLPVRPEKIFGDAKPVDTNQKTLLLEERLLHEKFAGQSQRTDDVPKKVTEDFGASSVCKANLSNYALQRSSTFEDKASGHESSDREVVSHRGGRHNVQKSESTDDFYKFDDLKRRFDKIKINQDKKSREFDFANNHVGTSYQPSSTHTFGNQMPFAHTSGNQVSSGAQRYQPEKPPTKEIGVAESNRSSTLPRTRNVRTFTRSSAQRNYHQYTGGEGSNVRSKFYRGEIGARTDNRNRLTPSVQSSQEKFAENRSDSKDGNSSKSSKSNEKKSQGNKRKEAQKKTTKEESNDVTFSSRNKFAELMNENAELRD